MRMRTAGRRLRLRRADRARPSSRGAFRAATLAVVIVAAGLTAGSAPAVSQQSVNSSHTAARTTAGSAAIWIAAPGGSVSAPGSAQVTDTKTGTVTSCTSVTLGGVLQTEKESGTGIGSFTSATFAHCQIGSISVTLTSHGLPWTMSGAVYNATAGVTTGFIQGIDLVAAGAGCSATLDGTAPGAHDGLVQFSYTNSTAKLALLSSGSDLHWWAVSGCSGLIKDADAVQASGTLTVSPAQSLAEYCAPFRKGIKLNPRFPIPTPPPGAKRIHAPPEPGCAYVTGFTNAQKLHEAALVGPAFADLIIGLKTFATNGDTYLQIDNAGESQYHGRTEFPPARATLLAFGFMPVSATLEITQIGSLNAIFVQRAANKFGCKKPKQPCAVTIVSARISIRIYNVSVNGTPLNVGAHCQTTPFNIKLKGVYPQYTINTGGPLTGVITIPEFNGCANGTDDLNSIFTAPVSGAGNDALLTQGPPCVPIPGSTTAPGCPPVKPVPKH